MPRQKILQPTLIYWLVDTRTNTPFYCGKTIKSIPFRLRGHFQTARMYPLRRISVRLLDCKDSVRVQIMETVPAGGDWAERERRWIKILRHSFPAVNVSDGGDGTPGNIPTAETRAKMSAARKGFKLSPEHKAKLMAGKRNRPIPPVSAETRAKLSAARLGKPLSAEHRAKVTANLDKARETPWNKGRPLSTEHRAKVSAFHKGRPKSAETRKKMSAAQTGRRLTPEHRDKLKAAWRIRRTRPMPPVSNETRAKLSAACKGRKRSDEARANMSAAAKTRKPRTRPVAV